MADLAFSLHLLVWISNLMKPCSRLLSGGNEGGNGIFSISFTSVSPCALPDEQILCLRNTYRIFFPIIFFS